MGRNQPAGELGRERTTTSWAPLSYSPSTYYQDTHLCAGTLATVSPCARSFHGPLYVTYRIGVSVPGGGLGLFCIYPGKRRKTHNPGWQARAVLRVTSVESSTSSPTA